MDNEIVLIQQTSHVSGRWALILTLLQYSIAYIGEGGVKMLRKTILSLLIPIFVLVVLSGCNSGSSESSYGAYLIIDGKEYTWQGDIENNEFTVADKIGEVNNKVDKEVMPKDNLSSNFLEVGEEIYTSNEDSKVVIVKREHDGNYDKFTESDYYKEHKSED
ncbi:hypothetical protein [Psychrobacillus sp. BL-248-WT-3]|uniref:hypothetical protein n=1 Tax=Psychrobacillus sp. BL-248-WT-3 TaxID=2725306 RepID=UPI00146D6D0A|nr:hypothetical protein [Psychrobacillus sp. BL-248-WT-3]NME05913.1 hypothetical protein [Psychrobacillus sp. BL-248-WT-3]